MYGVCYQRRKGKVVVGTTTLRAVVDLRPFLSYTNLFKSLYSLIVDDGRKNNCSDVVISKYITLFRLKSLTYVLHQKKKELIIGKE